jgi:Holliday junction resolvase RusA-like endonuclease
MSSTYSQLASMMSGKKVKAAAKPTRVRKKVDVTVGEDVFPLFLEIPLAPIVKKNSRPIFINKTTGKPFIGKSDELRDWEKDAEDHLRSQLAKKGLADLKLDIPLLCTMFIYRAQSSSSPGDLSNYVEAPQDAMEKAGVMDNDRRIRSLDGTRLLQDKRPRIEILLWPLEKCPYAIDVEEHFDGAR